MSVVVKERCPDCGKTFKNLSNHKICHSRGSGKHADKSFMVERQVCPDCGRDFVNLANHKICHGRGTGIRRTWQLVPSPIDSDYGLMNTPPPTTGPSSSVRRSPAPEPQPSNRERQTPGRLPQPSNRERQTPNRLPSPVQRQGQTPTPMPASPSRQTPSPTPGSSQTERWTSPPIFPPLPIEIPLLPICVPPSYTDRLTPPPTPPPLHREGPTPLFNIPPSYTDRLTPPPTPPPLHREGPTPLFNIPPSHRDRLTPSPTERLYPSIPTYPHEDENNHDQSHQQCRQPCQQPQHPLRQWENQQRDHADYRPHLHGAFSDLLEGQRSWRGGNSYNGDLSDEDALAVAIAASQNLEGANLGSLFRDEQDISAVPTGSQRLVNEHLSQCREFGANRISINRDSVWSSSMAFFKDVHISNTAKQLMVAFTDSEDRREEGIDTGGPRREYLRLLLESIVADSKMLNGDRNQGLLIRANISAYSKKHFRVLGVMLATIIAQGGQSPTIFAPPVVDAILDNDELPSVDYVPDTRTRESLKRVSEARDMTELEEALEECDWRYDLDGIPPVVTMDSRDEFLRGCVQYLVILQSKPMLDQMIEGLRHCGILELIRRHSLRDLLEYKSDIEVTAERVMDLLKPDEHCHGNEQRILDNLSRFLQAAEDGSLCNMLRESQCLTRNQTEFAGGITPGRLLAFVTGCSREPAGGFVPKPSIAFNYSATWRLPSAATCSNQILITVHQNSLEFHSFCQAMMTSMMNGENFTTA
ncbi:uncharacterized protein [Haliotis asinina]|uniref:uncharacterized protein n=1 Tax=Haliotis asinina TaxID=109174 RepID=UPI003531C46F